MRARKYRVMAFAPAAFAVIGIAASAALGAVEFKSVDTLGGTTNAARGVSPDGTVVVGESDDGTYTQGFIWDGSQAPPVVSGIGFPPDVESYSSAAGVDVWSDGVDDVLMIAVRGKYYDFYFDETKNQTFLWMGSADGTSWQPGGPWYEWWKDPPGAYLQAILFPSNDWTDPNGIAVVGNETYITGYGRAIDWPDPPNSNYYHAFRWRSGNMGTYDGNTIQYSMLDLLYPAAKDIIYPSNPQGGTLPSYGYDISKFGQVVGQVQYAAGTPGSGARHAFYREGNSWTILPTVVGTPPSGSDESSARAVSLDGGAVVGWADADPLTGGWHQAFHWAKGATTATAIPYLNVGDDRSEALAVSGYGQLVGGFSGVHATIDSSKRAFIWDAVNGTQDVKAWLEGSPNNIDMTGWTLTEVTGISQDGSVMCGNGTYDGGSGAVDRAWVVTGLPAYGPALPVIAEVTPDPGITNVNVEYKRQLTLLQGMLSDPAPLWEVVTGPTGLAVTQTGAVYGWTPGALDVGTSVEITIRVTNASGSDDETWYMTILNSGPTVNPVLNPDGTSVVVSGLDGLGNNLTRVTLYRNRYNPGTEAWEEAELTYADASSTPPLATNATSYTFTLSAGDLQLDDVIKATQHRGTIESDRGFYWRTVLPPLPVPQPATWTDWGFSDDFELLYIKPQWNPREPMSLVTSPARGQQAIEENLSGGNYGMDATSNLALNDRHPQLFEVWMLDEGAGLGGYARHVTGVMQSSTGGFNQGTIQYLFEVGCLPTVRWPTRQPADPNKYQWRVAGPANESGDMDATNSGQPAPARSPGWHKINIKLSGDKVFWYVDGIMGHRRVSTAGKINAFYLGTWSGNTGTVSDGAGHTVTLDGMTAYYDDLVVKHYTNRVPEMPDPVSATVAPGVAMTPIVVAATDPDVVDGIAPDYAYVQTYSQSFTGLNWTQASKELWGTGKFNNYEFHTGDQINITAGTNVTPGLYTVTGRVSNDAITLAEEIYTDNIGDASIAGIMGTGSITNPATWTPTFTYVTGTPSGTVKIEGTPPVGAAGETYVYWFQGRDDLNNLETGVAWDRTRVTITVGSACTPPTIDTMTPAAGVQGTGNRTYYTDMVPPGPTPPAGKLYYVDAAPLKVVITGTGFVDGGTTVKLVAQNPPVGGEAQLTVTPTTVTATQIDGTVNLTGSFPGSLDGVWDLVVTTCDSATKTGAFTVSMCFPARQDTDGDGDVDLGDFSSVFQACFNGPNRPYKLSWPFSKDCACMDVHEPLGTPAVDDVDLSDFTAFQGCFNGPNRPVKSGC